MIAIIDCGALQTVRQRHLRPPPQYFTGAPIVDAAAPLLACFRRAMLGLQPAAHGVAQMMVDRHHIGFDTRADVNRADESADSSAATLAATTSPT